MNFWTGILIGVFAGTNIGIVVTALLAAAKRSDDAANFHPDRYPMDEAVIDDAVPSGGLRQSLAFTHSEFLQPHAQDLPNS